MDIMCLLSTVYTTLQILHNKRAPQAPQVLQFDPTPGVRLLWKCSLEWACALMDIFDIYHTASLRICHWSSALGQKAKNTEVTSSLYSLEFSMHHVCHGGQLLLAHLS